MVTMESKLPSAYPVSIPAHEDYDVNTSSPEEANDYGIFGSPAKHSPCTVLQCEVEPTKNFKTHSLPVFVLGVCALEKKTKSIPMKEILHRLNKFNEFKIIVFSNDTILKQSVQDWPICDGLITFHSKGFPLSKVIKYVELREPICVNNPEKMKWLLDRSSMYKILEQNNIPIPNYAVLRRDKYDGSLNHNQKLIEEEDYIEVGLNCCLTNLHNTKKKYLRQGYGNKKLYFVVF
eukprot:gb/GECH01004391.1/.p1 GENE.gb/GECH01004391.1/~~gb/GECH01004391.1/.p1  ORF type:complete len:234 (+),score=41.71 gb/GECH01004391.1/:1-702(+)